MLDSAPSLTATLTTATSISALDNAPTYVKTCAELVGRLYADLQVLFTLQGWHQEYLDSSPVESRRIESVIEKVKDCLLDIGSLLDGVRKEIYSGKVGFVGFLDDEGLFLGRSKELEMGLVGVRREIEWLRGLKEVDDGDFENVELLRLGSRQSVVKSKSALISVREENGRETSGELMKGKRIGSFREVGSRRGLMRVENAGEKGSEVKVRGDIYSRRGDRLRVLPPSSSTYSEQGDRNSISTSMQGINRHQPHDTEQNNILALQQLPPLNSQPSSSLSIRTRTSSNANTFAMQALRETEFEDDFPIACSSPSSAGFMSSRVSTISSRTSFGSFRSNNSLPRAPQRPPPKPPKPKLLMDRPNVSEDTVTEFNVAAEDEDEDKNVGVREVEVQGGEWYEISENTEMPLQAPITSLDLLERETERERKLLLEIVSPEWGFARLPPPRELISKPPKLLLPSPIEDNANINTLLYEPPPPPLPADPSPSIFSFSGESDLRLGSGKFPTAEQFESVELSQALRENVVEEEEEDMYFRDLKLQEIERKKRVAKWRK